jgi:hypothetical protein
LKVESTHVVNLLFQVAVSDVSIVGVAQSVIPQSENWILSHIVIDFIFIRILLLLGCKNFSKFFDFLDMHLFLVFKAGQLTALEQVAHVSLHVGYPLQHHFDVEVVRNFVSELAEFPRLRPTLRKFKPFQHFVERVFDKTEHIKR